MKIKITALVVFFLGLFSCKEEEPQHKAPHLLEEIHQMQVLFVEENTSDTLLFNYYDPDGDGGVNPTITSSPLKPNTDYELFLDFFQDTDTIPYNINMELVEEGHLHQVFFEPDTSLKITFNYADSDINSKPVGYKTYAYTKQNSSGNLGIRLLHEPDKSAPGVADGDSKNAAGKIDFAAVFQINIQ